MAEERIYIDTEPGWQFSLADLLVAMPLIGIGRFVSANIGDLSSTPGNMFGVAIFLVLLLILAELLATFIAFRWVFHSLRWLKNRGTTRSQRASIAFVVYSLCAAWASGLIASIAWMLLVFLSVVLGNFLIWSEVMGIVVFYSLCFANTILAVRLYCFVWRNSRPRVWVPAESPAHDG